MINTKRFFSVPLAILFSTLWGVSVAENAPEIKTESSAEQAVIIKKLQESYGKTWVMMPYEVTFNDWEKCVDDNGCNGYMPDDTDYGRGKRPVINVNHSDALAYADWLSKKKGKRYRLPTVEEWEVAARAGTTTEYWWGDEVGFSNANCNGCGSNWDGEQTAPVGKFKPNPYGLYDTAGNVWERTSTCLDGACTQTLVCGGAWLFIPMSMRISGCTMIPVGARLDTDGFRLLEEL